MAYREHVHKERDNEAVQKLVQIARLAHGAKLTVNFNTVLEINEERNSVTPKDETYVPTNAGAKAILEANGFLIKEVAIEAKYNDSRLIKLYYRRNSDKPGAPPNFKELFDYIEIGSTDANKENGAFVAAMVVEANRVFRTITDSERVATLDSERAAIALIKSEFNHAQQEAIKTLVEKAAGVTTAVANQVLQLSDKLHKDYQNRSQELELERTKLTTDIETERTKIRVDAEKERKELEKERNRVAELSHRVMRINTAKRISRVIRHNLKTVGTSWSTKWKIVPAFLAYFTLAALLLFAVVYLGYFDSTATINTIGTGEVKWYIVVREITLTAGFVAAMTFFILWLRRIYEKSADSEANYKKQYLDMLRASWVFEMVLEWKKTYKTEEPPEQFIERFSRDLFTTNSEPFDTRTPFDLLNASKLKITSDGVEIAIDHKEKEKHKPKPEPEKPEKAASE